LSLPAVNSPVTNDSQSGDSLPEPAALPAVIPARPGSLMSH
jgi:hypothetical protein